MLGRPLDRGHGRWEGRKRDSGKDSAYVRYVGFYAIAGMYRVLRICRTRTSTLLKLGRALLRREGVNSCKVE